MDITTIVNQAKYLTELPKPDRCIHYSEIHPYDRKELGYSNPFPRQRDKKWQGCYLFWVELIKWDLTLFSTHRPSLDDIHLIPRNDYILPLYAGRTSVLSIRLWQHCTGVTRWYNEFLDISDAWHLPIDGIYWDVSIFPYVFVWYVDNIKDQKALEHQILGKIRPPFNKQ